MHPLTRSCFLLPLLGRLFLLALPFLLGICLRSPWSPPFPLHAPALILPSLAKVRLSLTLTLSPLSSGTLDRRLCSFFFWQGRLRRTCQLFFLWPRFPFRQAQYVPVFPLKPAPFCTFFAGLGSTNKSAISLLFSYYLTLVLSSPPCPLLHLFSYLKLCGRSGRNCLLSPPALSDYNWSPDTRFSRGTTRLMSWPDGERYLRPLQSLVVSPLLSVVSTLVFSRTGGVLSHQNFLTHKFPRFPPRNLCSLVMLAVSSLQWTQLTVKLLSLYDWQNRESFLQCLWTLVPGHLSCHSARSSYGLFTPLTLWRLSVSLRPLVQTLGSCPASGAPWSSAMPPFLGRGRVNNNYFTEANW